MLQNQSNDVARFLKALLYISIGIIFFDFVIGSGLQYLYSKQKSGLLYRTTYSIDSTQADYIVVGSSRANHNYDPKVFETLLRSSFYNCGRDKQGLLYSCAVLSAITSRYSPKHIIIDIRPDEFTQSDEGTLATLLPYHNNNAIRPYLDYNSRFENIKLYSRIYPYNSLLTNLIMGLKKGWKEDYKGYVSLPDTNKDNRFAVYKETGKPDTIKIKAFKKLITDLDKKQIPVLLVISPVHYRVKNAFTDAVCRSAVEQSKFVSYLNYNNQQFWSHNKYYSDHNHLNSKGAAIFSAQLSHRLMQMPGTPRNLLQVSKLQ